VLIMLLATIAYGTQTMMKQSARMQAASNTAADSLQQSEDAARLKMIELVNYTKETEELRGFLKSWTPLIDRVGTAQEAENAVSSILRASGVLTISQKLEVKDFRDSNILIPKSLLGTIVVQDDYAKTMNLLGELERKLPLSRITSCHVKQGDTGQRINLEFHIEIPLVNLKADLSDKKK
jgi:hypothetical protein